MCFKRISINYDERTGHKSFCHWSSKYRPQTPMPETIACGWKLVLPFYLTVWYCSSCTFENQDEHEICIMCYADKPSTVRVVPQPNEDEVLLGAVGGMAITGNGLFTSTISNTFTNCLF